MPVTIIRPEKVDPVKVKILEKAIIDICVAAHGTGEDRPSGTSRG